MTPNEFVRDLKTGEPAPVYLFLGHEPYRRMVCRRQLVKRTLSEEELENGLTRHDLDEITLAEVIDDARALSLFAPNRLIWAASAEAAVPRAKSLFVTAIRQLTFQDVLAIYRGPNDAATRYLEQTTAATLRAQMRPIVDDSLSEVGALNTFRTLADQYNRLPLVAPIDADLTSHVLDHASTALFAQVAKEEAAIREDPAKRTTELLREVFSGT